MNSEKYRQFLLDSIPGSKPASGKLEVVCRCKSCPDSRDLSHGHMYISIPQNNDEPSFFNCFKCGYKGVVTHERLLEWGLYDTEISLEITAHNKRIAFNPNINKLVNTIVYNIKNTFITQDKLSESKLNYINNRLGLYLDYKDIIDNKIVLNLNDLLKENRITEFTRHKNIVNELDKYFLGFLSYDNNFINMRRLVEEGKVYHTLDKRYVNYNIFDKHDTSTKFYISPCKIDIASTEPIKIRIAEGPFDIMSIKYNLDKCKNQTIYAAVTGKGYKGLCRYLISTAKLMNLEFHIYLDSDVNKNVKSKNMFLENDLANYLAPFGYPMYVHKNVHPGEKDMGVRLEKINEYIERYI